MDRIQLTLVAISDQWEVLREALVNFSKQYQLSKRDEYYLILICEEWFFNIVNHGFPDDHHKIAEQSNIQISIQVLNRTQIEIIFEDEGKAFNPFHRHVEDTKQASIEQNLGGLGIYFVMKQLNNYHYTYKNHHNQTKMYYDIEQKESNE